MDIRPASTSDLLAISRLFHGLHPDAPPAQFRELRQGSRTFAAVDDGQVIGGALCSFVDYGLASYGMIEELIVDEVARGRGTGMKLLEACRVWLADETGVSVIFVSALNDDADAFYRCHGFSRCTGPWLYRAT